MLMVYGLFYGRSFRLSRVIIGRSVLKEAQQQLLETGRIEPNGSWRPYVFTNSIMIDGVLYRSSVATALGGFEDEGVFAMATNGTFIWMDNSRDPKVIPKSGYKPRLFPAGF